MATADTVIVPSAKDANLLPKGKARVVVVPPPISSPDRPQRSANPGRAVIVASWREEDLDGLRWLLDQVMPLLQTQGSKLDLHLIGRMSDQARKRVSKPVVIEGYVEDLEAAYRQAAVALVPLRMGAGVKFKTVEAILHRVPVVTTAVGAEGIEGLEGTSAVTDDPESFAHRLINVLEDSVRAQVEADALHVRVAAHHSRAAFEQAMERLGDLRERR